MYLHLHLHLYLYLYLYLYLRSGAAGLEDHVMRMAANRCSLYSVHHAHHC